MTHVGHSGASLRRRDALRSFAMYCDAPGTRPHPFTVHGVTHAR